MSVGLPVSKSEIDSRAGDIARQFQQSFENVATMQMYLTGAQEADLVALGFTSGEVAILKSAFADLEQLGRIWAGSEALATQKDFRAFVRQLLGRGGVLTFAPALGTHFNARVDRASLEAIRAFSFVWARIDCQQSSLELMADMIADCLEAGLAPLPIVYDLERLEVCAVHAGVTDTEWGNEPDGDILPSVYREQLEPACSLAAAYGLRLWAPAISNLDRDSLRWLELVRGDGWPAGLHGISVHRYGDGTFEHPHDGFSSRADEVRRLRELCDGRPFICTEFGYPTKAGAGTTQKRQRYLRPGFHLSETQQAAEIAKEWAFWADQGADQAHLYQINDGPQADEGYGIRRYPWEPSMWKPAAYQVPKEAPPMADLAMLTPNTVFTRADLVEVPGRPGAYGVRCPPGAETILSPKASGAHELRDMGALGGANETCKLVDNLIYFWQNEGGARLAWRFVDDAEA